MKHIFTIFFIFSSISCFAMEGVVLDTNKLSAEDKYVQWVKDGKPDLNNKQNVDQDVEISQNNCGILDLEIDEENIENFDFNNLPAPGTVLNECELERAIHDENERASKESINDNGNSGKVPENDGGNGGHEGYIQYNSSSAFQE